MDYKTTLNLPRTDFPMKADLVSREPERLERWEDARLYEQIMAARAGAPKFVLHDGPPFANGDVHIGTALNKTLKDILIRYKSLRGFCAPYVPGWDCHGLPIEFKVIQELRKAGNAATDPAAIRRECDAYARKYIQIQRQQFKRLGVLGDWENPYLTLNKEYEADELRLFADLVEQGFIYRGKKPVYWSIPCRTALAEAEVEYQDHLSPSIYVKFPLVEHPGNFLLIWTTTPWTLPANLAVAYNSNFTYSVVQVGAELYILETMLVGTVAEKCQWENYQIIRTLYPEHLKELVYQHPFCQRTGRLYAGDEFVDNQTGTGFVHIAPGHGMEDYLLGLREGLPIYSPVNDEGCSKCPRRCWANPFWKNTARAMPTRRCSTNCARANCCCTRRIITTAIRTAGAAKRPLFSAPWTNGSSGWTIRVSGSAPWRKLTGCNGCPPGGSIASKARWRHARIGAFRGSGRGVCRCRLFTMRTASPFWMPALCGRRPG
jgi:isoleucyl-tRNA synthetase